VERFNRLCQNPRVAAIGRNHPCPCGSGKKYKACCLDRDAAQRRGEVPEDLPEPLNSRLRLIEELLEFSERAHQRIFKQMREGFLRLDEYGEEGEEPEPLSDEEEHDWGEHWINALLFDFPSGPSGEVVAEAYLRRMAGKLDEASRDWLKAMLEAPLTPYEVVAVQQGKGVGLRSLWSQEERFLPEPDSEGFEAGDILAARLTSQDGAIALEGGFYLYPEGSREALVAEGAKYLNDNRVSSFAELEPEKRRLFSIVLHAVWNELVLEAENNRHVH